MNNIRWYPDNKEELIILLKTLFLKEKESEKKEDIHGFILPHAGYAYSGSIVAKALSLLKESPKRAIIIGPSHYHYFYGIKTLKSIKTPLGNVKIVKSKYSEIDYEHSIENQVPFLQFLNKNIEILPLVIGEISSDEAEQIAIKLLKEKNGLFIFSTDLSHFLNYEKAKHKDKKTIKIIEEIKLSEFKEIDACGNKAILILMHLCNLAKWKPKLIEYKNSGDITEEKNRVVGYASFFF